MQEYRVKETLHTDSDPTNPDYKGRVVSEKEASFILAGKGAVLTEKEAKRLGLLGSEHVEPYDADKAKAEHEARNAATHGAQARALANPDPQPVAEPVADTGLTVGNVIEVANSATDEPAHDAPVEPAVEVASTPAVEEPQAVELEEKPPVVETVEAPTKAKAPAKAARKARK